MCGIVAVLHSSLSRRELTQLVLQLSKTLRHRGPDWSGICTYRSPESFQDASPESSSNGSMIFEEEHQANPTSKHRYSCLAHERLAIVDPDSGEQPLKWKRSSDEVVCVSVNGEIYNHEDIKKSKATLFQQENYTFQTGSDCEVVVPLFASFISSDEEWTAELQQRIASAITELDGMFAFVLYNSKTGHFLATRDHMGIIPLYMGWGSEDGSICFASELKALQKHCDQIIFFPPGKFYCSRNTDIASGFSDWYTPVWRNKVPPLCEGEVKQALALKQLREGLVRAVKQRMMSDVPWGVLLSGGLDSSLVASIATRLYTQHQIRKASAAASNGGHAILLHKLHTFTIGLEGSPDVAAAKEVAKFLGTVHHSYTFTVEEGLNALEDLVYHLETYDVTTCRAATPMYLMSRKIKASGIKMVLSGEGSDEALAGYLYFHKAPNREELHAECSRKLFDLHYFDCLRANKSTSAWGLEARVPFLDRKFLDIAMNLDPELKMCRDPKTGEPRMEKWALRKAFDTPEDPYLPKEFLWRQKEQFSDGVGYSWIDSLRMNAAQRVSDSRFKQRHRLFPVNTPATKEAFFVRSIFHKHFPRDCAAKTVLGGPSIACSTAKAIEWDEAFKKMAASNGECSGRAVDVHDKAYKDAAQVAMGKVNAVESESVLHKAKKQKL